MYELLSSVYEGYGSCSKEYGIPFKGSHIISFNNGDTTYTYAYDDVEEMMRYIDRELICDSTPNVVFTLTPDKSKIVDIEAFSEQEWNDYIDYDYNNYNNQYIWNNGIVPAIERVEQDRFYNKCQQDLDIILDKIPSLCVDYIDNNSYKISTINGNYTITPDVNKYYTEDPQLTALFDLCCNSEHREALHQLFTAEQIKMMQAVFKQ